MEGKEKKTAVLGHYLFFPKSRDENQIVLLAYEMQMCDFFDSCCASWTSSSDFDILIIVSRWQYIPCNLFRSLDGSLALRIFHNITHERTTQQDRRLVQVVVFVAQCSHTAGF
jgi:hypothetical protein